MREITIRFWMPDGYLFAFGEEFAAESDLEQKSVHRIEALSDGTVTALFECLGPPETVERILEGHERVHDVVATADETTLFYVHFDPDYATRSMVEARRRTSLAVKMPARLRTDGSVIGTFIGDPNNISDALDLLPETIETEVLRMQPTTPGAESLAGQLTDRQREVLRVATAEGYYANPRTATQADVAAELDLSPATTGEHLRKIEARVLSQLVDA